MIYVCCVAELPAHAAALRPSHVVSLLPPSQQPPTPVGVANHHRVEIDDISEPLEGHILPEAEHVAALIAFVRDWPRQAPLLVHCFAGVSRSMAAALIAASVHHDGREHALALELRRRTPHAQPNRRLIELADDLLARDGRLVAAIEAMGPADLVPQGPLVGLALPE